jgi:hypothetical protein
MEMDRINDKKSHSLSTLAYVQLNSKARHNQQNRTANNYIQLTYTAKRHDKFVKNLKYFTKLMTLSHTQTRIHKYHQSWQQTHAGTSIWHKVIAFSTKLCIFKKIHCCCGHFYFMTVTYCKILRLGQYIILIGSRRQIWLWTGGMMR